MKEIVLNRGQVALVDDEDYAALSAYPWRAREAFGHWYAQTCVGNLTIFMHRFLMNAPKGIQVDHINGIGLDNQRANLRLATASQNQMNRSMQRDNTSGFKGVFKYSKKKWGARIGLNKRKIFLGAYPTKEEAAAAYAKAAEQLHGTFSNFARREAGITMANPNRTVYACRHRQLAVSAEKICNTRHEAEVWIATQEGDRKRVTQFRVGKFGTHQYQYAARVYRKIEQIEP